MLSGPGVFHEQETNEIHFQEIPSHVLSKGLVFVHLVPNKTIFSLWIFRI